MLRSVLAGSDFCSALEVEDFDSAVNFTSKGKTYLKIDLAIRIKLRVQVHKIKLQVHKGGQRRADRTAGRRKTQGNRQ